MIILEEPIELKNSIGTYKHIIEYGWDLDSINIFLKK